MYKICEYCKGTGKLGFQQEDCWGCDGNGFTGEHTPKVFLGGTRNESSWRDKLISMLTIDYFNPVVEDWTEEYYQEELEQREVCDYCLYVITPKMAGVYSIAEVVDDSNKRPSRTIFCVLEKDTYTERGEIKDGVYYQIYDKYFSESQLRSLDKVGRMIERNGGKYFKTLKEVADFLNNQI